MILFQFFKIQSKNTFIYALMLPVELKLQVVSSNHLSHLLNSYAFGFLWNSCAAIMEEGNLIIMIIIEKFKIALIKNAVMNELQFHRRTQRKKICE